MQDIDHFSEAKMSAMRLDEFKISLPPPLRSKFVKSSKGIPGSVLQGYRGPSRLRNDQSGDSATQEEYLGVQKIGFWFSAPKNINFLPVAGTLAYGMLRFQEVVYENSDWCYIYFKAGTGEMIDSNEATTIQNRNRKADEHYKNVEKLMQSKKFEEAFNEAKEAFDTCSIGYKHEGKFKETMDKANVQRAIQRGDQLRVKGPFEEDLELLTEAQSMTKDENVLGKINDSIALIYAKQGETFFNDGKYQKAKEKFELASRKTQQSADKDSFSIWLQRISSELEAADTKEEGDFLLNSQKYNEAIVQYKIALRLTQVANEKMKIRTLIQEADQKLSE